MKANELRALSSGDLELKLRELAQELLSIRLKSRTSGVEKPHQIRALRRQVARVHTILKESERGQRRPSASQAAA